MNEKLEMIRLALYICSLLVLFKVQNTTSHPISFNVVSHNGFTGFAIEVEIPEASSFGSQQLLFDTGSSTLAFCNKDLGKNIQERVLAYPGGSNVMNLGPLNDQCMEGPFLLAASYGNNAESYFWGYVYQGDLLINSHNNESNTRIAYEVPYVIMEEYGEKFMCDLHKGVLDGIWGFGFYRAGNEAHVLIPNGTSYHDLASDVMCFQQPCSSTTFDAQNPEKDWCYSYGSNSTTFYLWPVTYQTNYFYNFTMYGMYLKATISNGTELLKESISYNEGLMFIGDEAIYDNPYYDINAVHATVKSNYQSAYWDLHIESMQVHCMSSGSSPDDTNNKTWMNFTCLNYGCILDSGNQKLILPGEIVDQINSCPTDGQLDSSSTSGNLHIKFNAGGELLINLLDLQTLYLEGRGWIRKSDINGGQVVLGLPIWLWYYMVFDGGWGVENNAQISFVLKEYKSRM
jgi:hypothetical protein